MTSTTTQVRLVSEDETDLVWAAQKCDLEAFNQLVLFYQDRIFSLALRILGDEESAADIAQTTFLNAYLGLPGLRNGSFRSWLYRIAVNACYDELRQRKKHPDLPFENEEVCEERLLVHSGLAASSTLPEKECERHEIQSAVHQALNRLAANYRAVIVLVDLQDFGYREAARVLGIPIGTLKSRLVRARLRLRQQLSTSGELNRLI